MVVSENNNTHDYQNLPKIIWIFWDQGESNAPFLVKQCIASWRYHNSGWDIRVLDKAALKDTIDLEGLDQRPDITMQALSDVIRVKILMTHGGVWADSTLFCVQPLDSWLPNYFSDHFFAFASDRNDRLMTTWFLAGNNKSRILNHWTEDMVALWKDNQFRQYSYWGKQVNRKLTSLRKRNIISNNFWFSPLMLKVFRLFPYPVNMYIFEKTLDLHPELQSLWFDRSLLYDTPAEYLQNKLGMNSPKTDKSMEFITHTKTPVHKLNWRQDAGCAATDSNLEFLINRNSASEVNE
jgi:hypothetical protein